MNDTVSFLLNQVSFSWDDQQRMPLVLVADAKPKSKTHITLLMGANGTCKSRIMSSVINLMRKLEMGLREDVDHPSAKTSFRQEHDLECLSMVTTSAGTLFETKAGGWTVEPEALPSRILALANLVSDRFTFEDREPESSAFYHYLGVRQSSNLSTTGAMDSLVGRSLLEMGAFRGRIRAFQKWAQVLFPNSVMKLSLTIKHQGTLRALYEKGDSLRKLIEKDLVAKLDPRQERVEQIVDTVRYLLKFLDGSAETIETKKNLLPHRILLSLKKLSELDWFGFDRWATALDVAYSAGVFRRPSLEIWQGEKGVSFSELSSGEQNLLSTGARLFAFARPRSLILIDEPEVSLNVAWQQRYIELILQAIAHAPGSHVIIASHSPYLVSDLKRNESTVVVIEKKGDDLRFQSHAGEFWGWGAEAVLYEVLGIPSASNYHFSRELAAVLKLVQERSLDTPPIDRFLQKCDQLEFEGEAEPLNLVIEEIRAYLAGVKP